MIYDCFTFFNELDLLELRLKTLYPVVDRFVIAESNYTHTGKRKPLYFKENKERFTPFLDKIIHVVSPDPEFPDRAASDIIYRWTLENVQRNATVCDIADNLTDDDLLIISDLDEIPSPAAIEIAARQRRPVRLLQKLYYYYLNYRCCTTPYWRQGSVVLPARDFANTHTYDDIEHSSAVISEVNVGPTATKVRFLRNLPTIKNGGWHFSYMGGLPSILTKLNSIVEGSQAHATELTLRRCIETGNDPFDRGEWYFAEKIDASFPPAIVDYPAMIFNVTPDYLRRVRAKRIFAYFKGFVRPLAWKLIPHPLALWLSKRINAQ